MEHFQLVMVDGEALGPSSSAAPTGRPARSSTAARARRTCVSSTTSRVTTRKSSAILVVDEVA
jgi:hypothetical protein